jgi:hypothetical protein
MKNDDSSFEKCRARYARLKEELQGLGFVCVGSLQTRYLECGKAGCHCHEDPANRHGPYHYWTRKVQGRTVAVLIGEDDLITYQQWIANNRALEKVVREMRKVAARALTLEIHTRKTSTKR